MGLFNEATQLDNSSVACRKGYAGGAVLCVNPGEVLCRKLNTQDFDQPIVMARRVNDTIQSAHARETFQDGRYDRGLSRRKESSE